jgi:hypothetical protein
MRQTITIPGVWSTATWPIPMWRNWPRR